jgi:anti-sigma B factor antagonist
MTELNLTTQQTPDGVVLAVNGDLDYDNAGVFRALVQTVNLQSGQTLTLDLAALTFCDSSGITALVAARNHVQADKADIVLINTPANTVRVLQFVGLDQIFRIHPATAGGTGPP